jgi:hypothetical protein
MTTALLERPTTLFDDADAPLAGGRPVTLEERLTSALDATRTNGSTECPVCDARMTRDAAGAHCTGCGSRLS